MIDESSIDSRSDVLDLDPEPFESSELRWFSAGPVPQRYVDWFTEGGDISGLEIRRDAYWIHSGSDRGLKRRSHSVLEVKERLGLRYDFAVDGRLTGRLEHWRKYRYGRVEGGRIDQPGWVDVDKVVLTRRFTLTVGDQLVQSSDFDPRRPGCDVELASIVVDGFEGWTFGFEAYGPADRRLDMIRSSAASVISTGSYPAGFVSALGPSMGYPEWLASLLHGGPAAFSRGA